MYIEAHAELKIMAQLVKRFWRYISFLGIDVENQIPTDDLKIRIFFNRCLFVGFFSLIGTLLGSYAFIGNYALLNLVNCLAILVALYLHVKGYFKVAKRIIVYSLFAVGLVLTSLSGGDFLYLTGIITVLTFAWVMFSPKKELYELILFLLLAVSGYLIGELNPFNAPDFSQHPDTPITRIMNLVGYTFISIIFISFIRRLNLQYEDKLEKILSEKEELIKEVLTKTKALEDKSDVLEIEISKRTSELLEQKKSLEEKNTEKEILLKEIHHRVKNNLQIIVSLLNLKSRKFEDQKVIDAINETQNRIISMSLVHQRMYQTTDFVALDFKEYSELLFQNIRMLYSVKEKGIKHTNFITSDIKVDIETAIPLGLVINELITNSFKHAFKDNKDSKEISIYMDVTKEGVYVFKYKDNGYGMPNNTDQVTSQSLGIQLINALVEQINGEMIQYNEDGAVFEITFKGDFKAFIEQ